MRIPFFDRYFRVEIPPAELAVLIDLAAADPARPLSSSGADWSTVFAGVCRNGLIGLTYHYLAANPNLPGVPETFRTEVKQAYLLHTLRMTWINRNIQAVLALLNASEIDYLVVKGPAAAAFYPGRHTRVFNDLDLIVRERDWAAFARLLLDHGYQVLAGEAAPPPKVIAQEVDHETEFINPEGNFRVEAHYDDLLRTGLAARDPEAFWQRAVPMTLGETPYRTLCPEDTLIYLCAHAHHHGYTRLNWFSDLALFLAHHGPTLNWQQLIQTVRREEAQVPVYYGLAFTARLFGLTLPDGILTAVQPDALRRWIHDRLMPPARVLAFLPLPNIIFSFYYYPLFQRLLPDLLVMGRRRDKLGFLLRVWFPPAAWLRYIYKLAPNQPVGWYYLRHPLKTLWIYVEEAFRIITRGHLNEMVNH